MRKTIGIVRPAFTAKPLAFPGSHLGMALTSRTASFARDGSTAPTAFMAVIVFRNIKEALCLLVFVILFYRVGLYRLLLFHC